MLIRKMSQDSFLRAPDVLYKTLYPWQGVVETPFKSEMAIVKQETATHLHNHHDGETFVIVQGHGIITSDGETATVEPGDVIYFPPLSKHTLRNTSLTEDLVYMSVWWEDMHLLQQQTDERSVRLKRPQRVVIINSPITPNGDLHLGHLAGPLLCIDVYRRYLEMRGVEVYTISGTDDYQSYVALKAHQLGLTPQEIVTTYSQQIEETLQLCNIQCDVFAPAINLSHADDLTQSCVQKLYREGKLILKEDLVLYCNTDQIYLTDAYIRGACPHCGAKAAGNGCEECGWIFKTVELANPICILCKTTPEMRPIKQLYFPLSAYRQQLEHYYASASLNPRIKAMCYQALAKTLPDIPITHMGNWGVPVPLEGFEDAKLNPYFAVGVPWFLGVTQMLLEGLEVPKSWQDIWYDPKTQVVVSFGFDTIFVDAIFLPSVLLAYDPNIQLPASYLTNEFYLLDHAKFSTTGNHLIFGRSLIAQTTTDVVRFYLAYTRPEYEQTNFTYAEFHATVRRELIEGWQLWLQQLGTKISNDYQGIAPEAGIWSGYHESFYRQIKQTIAEVSEAYELETFTLQQAARSLCRLVAEAQRFSQVTSYLSQVDDLRDEYRTVIALELMAAKTIALLSAPLMPDFAAQLWQHLGYTTLMSSHSWEDIPTWVPSGQGIGDLGGLYFPDSAG